MKYFLSWVSFFVVHLNASLSAFWIHASTLCWWTDLANNRFDSHLIRCWTICNWQRKFCFFLIFGTRIFNKTSSYLFFIRKTGKTDRNLDMSELVNEGNWIQCDFLPLYLWKPDFPVVDVKSLSWLSLRELKGGSSFFFEKNLKKQC